VLCAVPCFPAWLGGILDAGLSDPASVVVFEPLGPMLSEWECTRGNFTGGQKNLMLAPPPIKKRSLGPINGEIEP
jgi:hypothetical protein